VLVVGASASGVQLADEIRRSGRDVVLAVGRHTRLPRHYRGRDILYWLDRIGALTRPLSDVAHPDAASQEPSQQLVGGEPPATLDLAVLTNRGVQLAGRLEGFDGPRACFADDLARTTAEADARLHRLLARIDRQIETHGLARAFPPSLRPGPVPAGGAPLTLDLGAAGIRSVLWATGYARAYPWLHAPVLDARGEIRQVRGRTPAPGLYVLGLQFMIRRNSSLMDGVGRDALEIADEISRRARSRRMEAA
jgi:putative flavoprotein involved in K+ transport